ncbi:MAG: hypothetical protein HY649_07950 [Acidobacteria bacterium]|nr:hypothetical protein [Acidobacteriota bacterium]
MKNRWKAALVLIVLWASVGWAVRTQFWTTATFDNFLEGTFQGVSLHREGFITLAPQLEEVFNTDQAMVWAAARDSKQNIYLGTGHSGKVFRLGPDMKGTLFFDAPEPDVFALAVGPDASVFVGTSPEGKVYRVDPMGQSAEFFDPQAKYIWAMVFGTDGALYVGTGDRGKIFRVAADGKGELFYDTQQAHVMSLALDTQLQLIAGTEPNGLLFRVSGAAKGFVLYDAPLAEIHSVAVASDGSIYASAMGAPGGVFPRQPGTGSPGSPVPAGTVTTITVRAAQEPSNLPAQPTQGEPNPEQPQPDPNEPQPSGPVVSTPQRSPMTPTPIAGRTVTQSALFRIWPDNAVDTLWESNRENIFGLLPSGDDLLFSTDERGRIYQMTPDRQITLVTQTDQEEATRLIPLGNSILVTTANLGKVYRLGTQPSPTGYFESQVQDSGSISGWGKIRWSAEMPQGTAVELYSRSGNSSRPDATWSEWSSAYRKADGEQIQSPTARYVQWKAVFQSAGNRAPALREVTVAYLPRNRAPAIAEVKATTRDERTLSGANTGGGRANVAVRQAAGGGTIQTFPGAVIGSRPTPEPGVDISWLTNDPDQDELTYSLYFRGEGEADWKLLKEDLSQNYFQLEKTMLPDGRYRVKVVATDARANPPQMAKAAERVSAPFVVDSTPPQVEVIDAKRVGGVFTVRFLARDSGSVLMRAEYAQDAQPLVAVLSDDGILDSDEETFTVVLDAQDAQERLLTLRVYDSAGNTGVGKTILPGTGSDASR